MADELNCSKYDRELFEMCRLGDLKAVTDLIDNKGARPGRYVDYVGKNGMMMAAERGHCEVVKKCIDSDPSTLRAVGEENVEAAALAAANGHTNTLCCILEAHRKYFPKINKSLTTPLSLASYNGHLSCVQKLIEFGADPRIPDEDGYLPHQNSKLYGSHPKQKRQQRHEETANYLSKL
eukprot:TRINITY_DN748_c6_g1_i1.p1 TRINITY_DN748_c6_g1~~TRINITY_DN748_c6_g1_i1.p1  ORF type:complete len:179 (+),score=23.74 TRINITY_DN748_c6_g1_i1:66-602(+)